MKNQVIESRAGRKIESEIEKSVNTATYASRRHYSLS